MLNACLMPITLCFIYTSWCFYWFPATNILTRCQSASSCFLLFLVPGELKNKYSRNWKRKLFYEVLHRKTPEARRGAEGGPQGAHTLPRRGDTPGRAWCRCGPPGPPLAPPFRLFIHPDGKTLDIAQKFQKEVHSRRHHRGEI